MPEFSPLTRIIITLCFMALLLVLSVMPGRAQPGDSIFIVTIAKTPPALQKTLHVFLYGCLTLLWSWSLAAVTSTTQRLVFAVGIAVLFGAALEWYQTRIPGRFGTLIDVLLNAAGALLGLVAALLLL